MSKKLAIIGTAGRGDDGIKLASNPKHYLSMMYRASKKVAELTDADTLVSGGSAWADDLAVQLFWNADPDGFQPSLELYLPRGIKDGEFVESLGSVGLQGAFGAIQPSGPIPDIYQAGKRLNELHWAYYEACQDMLGCEPIKRIESLLTHHRVSVKVNPGGFKARNGDVAFAATDMLAMTFGSGKQVKDGGTADTCLKFLCRPDHGTLYHLSLTDGKLYKGGFVYDKSVGAYRE